MPYTENAAGIFVERGEHITVRGVELECNGNGFFVASGDSEEVLSRDILLERSCVHGNGTLDVGPDRHHNIYTEAVGMVFQFNDIGPLAPGALGAALKDRSTGTVVRYNRIEGGARSLDLVDAEDSLPLARGRSRLPHHARVRQRHRQRRGGAGPILSNMIHYGGDSGRARDLPQGHAVLLQQHGHRARRPGRGVGRRPVARRRCSTSTPRTRRR